MTGCGGASYTRACADCPSDCGRYSTRAISGVLHMPAIRFDVLGIGNAIVDVIARIEDDFLIRHNMRKGTMALIDEQQAASIYAAMGPAVEVSGGSAANTTVGVASLGARGAFIGRVRDDELGRVFTHDIRAGACRIRHRPP
jgi:sugar/nucleoside kinase (ribokinase family)